MANQQRTPFGLRMPEHLKAWIAAKAAEDGRSMNQQICRILAKAMAADEKPNA